MAAYASLVSVMNIMEQIEDHPRLWISLDKKQIESLREKVSFLEDFIESLHSHGGSKEAQVLESQIASAAYAAEDVIESHVVDQILVGKTSSSFLLDLQKVIEKMDSVKKKVMKVKEKGGFKDQLLTSSMHGLPKEMKGIMGSIIKEKLTKDQHPTTNLTLATSSRPISTEKNKAVGFGDELIQIMDRLTGQQSHREIISIIGMGGIGKTTLAKTVYDNLLIVQYFDIRGWATVSQNYSVKGILLELLSWQRKSSNNGYTKDQLGEMLYKSLYGKRYLIILDDLWSIEAWDKIKFFFPENNTRSRVVITSRLSDVATHFGSSWLAMNFLDEDKSWDLFCEKAFAQAGCPLELEEIGKEIAKKCKGLPLSIVVIGGLLRKSSRTRVYWKDIAKNLNSILNSEEDEHYLNILSLSYNHLPAHLKPCFLYMGIFPEDHEIRISQLIKLWVAEGFMKPNKDQSLEETAKGYLKDLIDRNLIMECSLGSNGKL